VTSQQTELLGHPEAFLGLQEFIEQKNAPKEFSAPLPINTTAHYNITGSNKSPKVYTV
jgi:hypothetical protein